MARQRQQGIAVGVGDYIDGHAIVSGNCDPFICRDAINPEVIFKYPEFKIRAEPGSVPDPTAPMPVTGDLVVMALQVPGHPVDRLVEGHREGVPFHIRHEDRSPADVGHELHAVILLPCRSHPWVAEGP